MKEFFCYAVVRKKPRGFFKGFKNNKTLELSNEKCINKYVNADELEDILKQLKVLEDREIPYDFVAMNAHSLEEEENITIQHKFHSEELIYSLKPEKYFGKIDVLKLNNYLTSCFFERRIYDN